MERLEFLKKLGLGGGALVAVYCTGALGGCKKKEVKPEPENKDFILDLNSPSYSALKNNGTFIIYDSVVVAKTTSGNYVAVTQICSHEQNKNVVYLQADNEFYCSVHGARYNVSGVGLNSNGSKGIKVYSTVLNGTMLRIFG